LDYESLVAKGAIMGSGGLVVLGKKRCLVDLARHLVHFMAEESCGKCAICRDGLQEMENKLLSLTIGKADNNVLPELEDLGHALTELSQCGVGQSAAKPVLTL
jgi:NADH-quinone oxidoreductase subunit F